jgi:hypothetical protein
MSAKSAQAVESNWQLLQQASPAANRLTRVRDKENGAGGAGWGEHLLQWLPFSAVLAGISGGRP